MKPTKFLDGPCGLCGGPIRYSAELVGTSAQCPHCGKMTELVLAVPQTEPAVPRRIYVWSAIVIIIVAVGFAAISYALKKAQSLAAANRPQAQPTLTSPAFSKFEHDFEATPVNIEAAGSGLRHAVGQVRNVSGRARKQVKMEFEMLNAAGENVGSTFASIPLLGPGEVFTFKAPLLDKRAVSAKLVSITQQQ